MSDKIKIAIQNSGRLTNQSIDYLNECGLNISLNKTNLRKLAIACPQKNVEILFLRSGDIPIYVQSGIVDFGITGENVIYEKKSNVKVLKKLGFAFCSLVIAIPNNSQIKNIADLNNERIATSYPNLLKDFLQKNGINAAIMEIAGSVEVTPALKLTDAICDLTQTGKTLIDNNLKPLVTVMKSQAVLITNPNNKALWKYWI